MNSSCTHLLNPHVSSIFSFINLGLNLLLLNSYFVTELSRHEYNIVFYLQVRTGFQAAGARHNATRSSVHAIWLCGNVTQISARRVGLISLILPRSLARMSVCSVVYVSYIIVSVQDLL
jgi:hypothetical protein